MRIESKDRFETLRAQARESNTSRTQQVLVCCGTGCLAWGSKKVAEAFASEIAKRSIDATVDLFVKSTGCHGFCERGPLVVLQPSGILYTKVKPNRVEEIVEKTLIGGEVIQNLLYKEPVSGERIVAYPSIVSASRKTLSACSCPALAALSSFVAVLNSSSLAAYFPRSRTIRS